MKRGLPVRIAYALKNPATTPLASPLHWYSWIRWNRRRGVVRKLRLARDACLWPIRAAGLSARATCCNGPAVRRYCGLPLWRQYLQQWSWSVRHRALPASYYTFGLYLPHRRRVADRFVDAEISHALLRFFQVGPDAERARDKLQFAESCARHHLPHVDTLAVFDGGRLQWSASNGQPLPRRDLFVKFRNMGKGFGAECWLWCEDHFESEGEALSLPDLLAHLQEKSRLQACIVQPRLQNHPELAQFSTRALCTVRIVTAHMPGGRPRHLINALRMGRGENSIDSFEQNRLACPIDLPTGRLGPAVTGRPGEVHREHPDTGATIDGHVLSMWHECLDLCVRAHQQFPDVSSIGWDVGVTPDGPVLIEANTTWGSAGPQLIHGLPLTDTEFPRIAHAYLCRLQRQQPIGRPSFRLIPPRRFSIAPRGA